MKYDLAERRKRHHNANVSRQHGKRRHKSKNTIKPCDLKPGVM